MWLFCICLSKIYLLEIHSTVFWSEVDEVLLETHAASIALGFYSSLQHWSWQKMMLHHSVFSNVLNFIMTFWFFSVLFFGKLIIGCFSLMFTPYCLYHWGCLEITSSPQHVFPRAPWLQQGAFPSHTQGRWTACTLEFSTALVTCKPWQHDCLLFLCKLVWIKLTASVRMETTNIANIQI